VIKVVHIINALNIGGSEKLLVDTINRLDPNKYEITIISLSLFDENKTISKIARINKTIAVHYLYFNFFNDYTLRGYFSLFLSKEEKFRVIPETKSILHQIKPHIVHFHTTPGELIIKKFLPKNYRYVFTDHSLRINKNGLNKFKQFLLSLLFKQLYTEFKVIAVSNEIESSLIRNNIVNRAHIETIANGIDTSFFCRDKEKEPSNTFIVVYVSRIEPTKGHADLINAWAQLNDIKNKQLYIVGPDGLNGQIQSLAEALGCANSILFTGSHSNPKEILSKSTIAVFPSYKEGMPLSLLEKMAMELPVIVSNIEELTHVVTHKKNGLVFNLGNHNHLAENMRLLYNNPQLVLDLGKNARITVERNYNSADGVKKIDEFYKRILN
jgi:glycosyltransferase involved in cell wall biosynthesis